MSDLVLAIEASTPQASVALLSADAVAAHVSVLGRDPETGARREGLVPAIATCLQRIGASPTQLSAVVCSAGPGSFTSLRSAAAIAKGFCSVLQVPLYTVSTLELLVASGGLAPGRYAPALDAGRGEFHVGVVDVLDDGRIADADPGGLVPAGALRAYARDHYAALVGPGLDLPVVPAASAAAALLPRITAAGPVPLDSWEPRYGRLAEAQVKWEAAHGRPLPS